MNTIRQSSMGRINVLFLSHTPLNDIIRVGSHHLSQQLARLGCAVTHVSRANDRRCYDHNGVHWVDLDSVVPWRLIIRMPILIRCWWSRRLLRLSQVELDGYDYILIDSECFFPFIEVFNTTHIIYRPTDYKSFRGMSKYLLRMDAVIATSEEIFTKLGQRCISKPKLVLENGVDLVNFPLSEVRCPPYSSFVYLGAIDSRIDWTAVKRFAANEKRSLTMAGPVLDEAPADILKLSNVKFAGPVQYKHASEFLKGFDAGFFPFNKHPMNETRSPMKFYEFLAAGLPILAAETPELKKRDIPGVSLYSSELNYDDALFVLEGAYLDFKSERDVSVSAMGWDSIAKRLLAFISGL